MLSTVNTTSKDSTSTEGAEQLDSGHSTSDSGDLFNQPRTQMAMRTVCSRQLQYERDSGQVIRVYDKDGSKLTASIRKETILSKN